MIPKFQNSMIPKFNDSFLGIFVLNRYHVAHCVIAGLTRNLQQINGIAGQARNDVRGYSDSGLLLYR